MSNRRTIGKASLLRCWRIALTILPSLSFPLLRMSLLTSLSARRVPALVAGLTVALLLLVGTLNARRLAAEAQLAQLSTSIEQLAGGRQDENAKIAQEVIASVSKFYELPTDVNPTVATIVDVEALRTQNPFYSKAENGDVLVITQERAILYSIRKNMILDVVPVQLEAAQENAEGQR